MGALQDAITWLRTTFGEEMKKSVAGTPFSENLLIAIALQETGYIWRGQYKTRTVDEVLAFCVGDTLDSPNRGAFPKKRADLEAVKDGPKMFKIARNALELLGTINGTYDNVAKKNPNKFCHGFGMFQYDIQSFKEDPDFFLDKKWETFEGTLGKCLDELRTKLKVVYGAGKKTLNHAESVYVAIAYNKGSADTSKNFKQGFKDSSGKYYGEKIDEFLTLAENTP